MITQFQPSFQQIYIIFRLNSDVDSALRDLDKAIELSKRQGRSGCQAFCQRGKYTIIHKNKSKLCHTSEQIKLLVASARSEKNITEHWNFASLIFQASKVLTV